MRKLNNMTRAVILLAICVLSIAAISFSWLSRPQVIQNDEQNFGKLLLSSEISAAGTGGTEGGAGETGGTANTSTSQIKAYTRMKDGSTAVTATTYLATIDAETGKYEQSTQVDKDDTVKIGANDCTYFITELKNTGSIPTRVSLKVPTLSDTSGLAIYSYAPYKDKADGYIVKNIEVINNAEKVIVKWYIANSDGTGKTISLNQLPSVEYFK